MDSQKVDNRRTFEYCLMAAAIALGVPVSALLGAHQGEKTAAYAYPREQAPAAPAERDWKSVVLASADAVEKGRTLFQANCVACHGAAGDGKGAAAAALVPAPRDFLDPRARWTRGRGPVEIYQTLTEGNPGTAMPGFAASLPPADRWALVHYLASLPGVKDGHAPLD